VQTKRGLEKLKKIVSYSHLQKTYCKFSDYQLFIGSPDTLGGSERRYSICLWLGLSPSPSVVESVQCWGITAI